MLSGFALVTSERNTRCTCIKFVLLACSGPGLISAVGCANVLGFDEGTLAQGGSPSSQGGAGGSSTTGGSGGIHSGGTQYALGGAPSQGGAGGSSTAGGNNTSGVGAGGTSSTMGGESGQGGNSNGGVQTGGTQAWRIKPSGYRGCHRRTSSHRRSWLRWQPGYWRQPGHRRRVGPTRRYHRRSDESTSDCGRFRVCRCVAGLIHDSHANAPFRPSQRDRFEPASHRHRKRVGNKRADGERGHFRWSGLRHVCRQ